MNIMATQAQQAPAVARPPIDHASLVPKISIRDLNFYYGEGSRAEEHHLVPL